MPWVRSTLVETLLPELAGRVVVAHAAPIERAFLGRLLLGIGGVPVPNPFVDTMAVERRLLEADGCMRANSTTTCRSTPVAGVAGCLGTRTTPRLRTRWPVRNCSLAQLAQFGDEGRVRVADLR